MFTLALASASTSALFFRSNRRICMWNNTIPIICCSYRSRSVKQTNASTWSNLVKIWFLARFTLTTWSRKQQCPLLEDKQQTLSVGFEMTDISQLHYYLGIEIQAWLSTWDGYETTDQVCMWCAKWKASHQIPGPKLVTLCCKHQEPMIRVLNRNTMKRLM